jgi:hypothetical protein
MSPSFAVNRIAADFAGADLQIPFSIRRSALTGRRLRAASRRKRGFGREPVTRVTIVIMQLRFVLARDGFLYLDWRAFLDLLFGEVNGDQFN